jgi:hypothetical protein
VAVLLAAAVQSVRDVFGRLLSTGTCLAILAAYFFETWKHVMKRRKTRPQRVRERDEGFCQVPGCSRPANHSHHVEFRSRGGSDDSGRRLCVPSPAVHPRRAPDRGRPGAGRAHVAAEGRGVHGHGAGLTDRAAWLGTTACREARATATSRRLPASARPLHEPARRGVDPPDAHPPVRDVEALLGRERVERLRHRERGPGSACQAADYKVIKNTPRK